jgi:tripartite-type tricarboxylate transporter receptor subunit TctC
MKTTPCRFALALAMAATAAALPLPATAQPASPSQPIKLVVPFTAGSGTDIIARAVGEQLEKSLKQPVIVENKPGAGGTLGALQVAQAPADGRTVLVHSAGHVANAALYPALKYDTLKDFTPVTMLATLPNVLVTSPARGWKSAKDLVDKAKAAPGTETYASAGNGSATHVNAEKFRTSIGIEATHVPFRGTPEAITDVIGGRVDWFFAPVVSALPLVKDGKLQALAVGTPKRSAALPDVPTTTELGFAGSDYTFWVGMFVGAKTPPAVVTALHQATVAALRTDAVKERLGKLGGEVAAMEQAQFAALVNSEAAQVAALVKRAGIRAD